MIAEPSALAKESSIVDVVIVGAGMAGIYSLYQIKRRGLSVVLLEAGGGVGGTWYWNRYPGARCDVESVDYSYSFSPELQREWRWTERFANQSEIQRYLNHIVDRFDLRSSVRLNARVNIAHYHQSDKRWEIHAGELQYSARYLIMATGLLSVPVQPDVPGLDKFKGRVYITGNWPEQPIDFAGRKVGLFGTGSSGMQVLPAVAKEGAHLTLFQRTASFAIPMRNGPVDDGEFETIVREYPERREKTRRSVVGTYWSAYETSDQSLLTASDAERQRTLEARWESGGPGFVVAFADVLLDLGANKIAADFVREKIRQIVKDRAVAEKLMPPDGLPIGCKRLCVESGYFEAFNRDNVHVVDLRQEPIQEITPHAIRTVQREYPLDDLIFATGFDAYSGAMLQIDMVGRQVTLREHWKDGPSNFLGLMVAGFPNMFMVNGPGTVAANFFLATEVEVDWICGLIDHAEKEGQVAVEATTRGEDRWQEHLQTVASMVTATNYCDTWFRGTNVAGKPIKVMNYLGGLGSFSDYCAAEARAGYPDLIFTR